MPINESKKINKRVLESSFDSDMDKLPDNYDLDFLHDTIRLIVNLGDEDKLKPEYKYHRDGDIHIVHVPDPGSYQRNPITKKFYKFSDWLILFKINETRKFKTYHFVKTGTHEYLKIKQEDE